MILNSEATVGQLVADQPGRARVFERLGIDYCCAGKKPLAQACSAKGLDPEKVLGELAAEDSRGRTDEPDWAAASPSDLAEHIEQTHHTFLRRELPRIEGLIEKVVKAHGQRLPAMKELQTVFTEFRAELGDHMLKEERVLFPWIRRMERGADGAGYPPWSVTRPVECMEHEHERAGSALEHMRTLAGGYTPPDGACNTHRAMLHALSELEADMHRHIHKENSILFPRAVELEAALKRHGRSN